MLIEKTMTAQSAKPAGAFLSLKALSKNYGDVRVVQELDLDLPRGELIALLGPSGCGKTTTLRMIAGLATVSSGRVQVGGTDVTDLPIHKRDMGMVFQSYALFPHMTIARNVAFGLEMRGVPREEIAGRVKEAIAMVRLSGFEERRPRELSGGQQQRVALARALVIRPSVLLLDEPLSNLDAKLRDEMRHEIRDIQQKLGITAVFVTHDQTEALSMCDKVAVMNKGRLEQIGTPQDLYENPATPFVAGFVGRINTLTATIEGGVAMLAGQPIHTRDALPARSGNVELMVRPHRVRIAPSTVGMRPEAEDNRVSGIIGRITYVGEVVQYDVDLPGGRFTVELPTLDTTHFLTVGTPVDLIWRRRDTLCYGADQ